MIRSLSSFQNIVILVLALSCSPAGFAKNLSAPSAASDQYIVGLDVVDEKGHTISSMKLAVSDQSPAPFSITSKNVNAQPVVIERETSMGLNTLTFHRSRQFEMLGAVFFENNPSTQQNDLLLVYSMSNQLDAQSSVSYELETSLKMGQQEIQLGPNVLKVNVQRMSAP